MAVKICMKNGRCLICDTSTVEDVSTQVGEGKTDFFCCEKKGKSKGYKFCIRISEIVSWEEVPKKPADDEDKYKDPKDRYRIKIDLQKEARIH